MARRRRLSLRDRFAARLKQARRLRGLSQRALGDEMGLGKDTGSTRINRYERGTSDLSLASLEELAAALAVPPAYLVADNARLADAILALSAHPALVDLVHALAKLPEDERVDRLNALLGATAP